MNDRTPSATANEIVASVVRGTLPTLLLTKRVTLPSSTAALRELEGFVGGDDARLRPLRELVVKLSDVPLRTKVARRVGESVIYKTQRPSTKKSAHVVVPVNILETNGPLSQVRVSFEDGRIVITRGDT
jgi:hypothetical protein